MIASILQSLLVVKERFFWGYLFASAMISAVLLAATAGGMLWWLDHWAALQGEGWFYEWLRKLTVSVGGWVALTLGYFLFPIILPFISLLFLDPIIKRMEKTYYPGAEPSVHLHLGHIFLLAVKFLCIALFLNILAIPFYFIPVVNIIVYYLLNSYLFGREYLEIVGVRYHPPKELRKLRYKHYLHFLLGGLLISLMFTTPVVNFIAPVLATVFMVHLYFRKIRPDYSEEEPAS